MTVSKKKSPSVSKKESALKPAQSAEQDPADTLYTLESLVAQIQEPVTEADVRLRVTAPAQELIAVGRTISTERIDTDSARIYGGMLSFYRNATPTQRRALVGCSLRLIEISIWAAHHGHVLFTQRDAALRSGTGRQQSRTAGSDVVRAQAKARRQQLKEALDGIAGGDPEALATITAAYGTIDTLEHFSEALKQLAAIGRRYLRSRDTGVKIRLADTQLDAAYLDETDALAAQTLQVGSAAKAARASATVAQDEVDLWDGINLALLERLLRVFEAGRAADPTIPRFAVLALRGWWNGYKPRKSSQTPPLPAGSPTTP